MTRNQELVFESDFITLKDQPNRFVMMSWETDLMKQHALRVTENSGDVLEIGFGMGISAQFIQDFGCNTHTIVESHPEILKQLRVWALDKPNVNVVAGDWFNLKNLLNQNQYDGIFYDADCNNSPKFRETIVEPTLKHQGVFTYFAPNGTDKYRYKNKLHRDFIKIQVPILKNSYHNDPICTVPYFINL